MLVDSTNDLLLNPKRRLKLNPYPNPQPTCLHYKTQIDYDGAHERKQAATNRRLPLKLPLGGKLYRHVRLPQ